MADVGTVWQRTAERYDAGIRTRTVPRHLRPSQVDRYGRAVRSFNRTGIRYEACTMCGQKAMVRHQKGCAKDYVDHWCCEACGYRDSDLRALV